MIFFHLNLKISHLDQRRDDYKEYPQEVPFKILPWSVGASPQPDCHGGVQLRHGDHHHHDHGRDDDSGEPQDDDDEHYHSSGGLLPALLLGGGADGDVHGELPTALQHKPSTPWIILSHTLVQAGQEQARIPMMIFTKIRREDLS